MKRMIVFISLLVLMLVGCTQKVDDNNVKQDKDGESLTVVKKEVEKELKKFTPNPENFHFIADWLSDTKIIFVDKEEDIYFVKIFDIMTGEIDTLYEEAAIIVDVLIHPSKKELLIHTTTNPTSAIVKIITTEGIVLDEITVASSELSIEWNDMDPTLVLLTAFYQDWTYDVFFYDGKKESINLIAMESPFPQWLGTKNIAIADEVTDSLNGIDLYIYNRETGNLARSMFEEVIYFETYKDSLLTVQLDENEEASYTISNNAGVTLSSWSMPAVINYAEWFFPEVFWLSPTTVILPSVKKGGQLDELMDAYKLVLVDDGEQDVLLDVLGPSTLRCSPDGKKCLTGYSKENMIDLKTDQEVTWLLLQN